MTRKHRLSGLVATALAAGLVVSAAAPAQEDEEDGFVEANLIATFYHELGHALIDVLELPIYGQEEDAADNASVFLIDSLFDEEDAVSIAAGAAEGYLLAALEMEESDEDVPYWDNHGPDLQRYYNIACLIYGADVDGRAYLLEEFELPEERAEYCEEEFDQANSAWGPVLDGLETGAPGNSLRLVNRETDDDIAAEIAEIIGDDVAGVNENFLLPHRVDVIIEFCDEANAFYDPETREITMCIELAEEFEELAERYPAED